MLPVAAASPPARARWRPLWTAAAVSLAGVLARLAYLHARTKGHWEQLQYPDEWNYYLDAARRIAGEGLGFFATERSLWNGPLNPLWILLWGTSPAAVKVANVLLLALVGLMAWDLARRRAGDAAGWIALALCTTYWPFFDFGPTILTEPPFAFLAMASLWLFDRSGGRRAGILGAGLAMGLATLVRPTLQLWPPGAAALAIAWAWRRGPGAAARARTWTWALFLVAYLLPVAPWIAKNQLLFHRPALANGMGAVLYLGTDLRTHGDEPVYVGKDFDTFEITAPYSHLDTEGDRRLLARAVQALEAHPLAQARQAVSKIGRVFVGGPMSWFFPYRDAVTAWRHLGWPATLRVLISLALTLGTLLLGLEGLRTGPRDDTAWWLLSLLGYFAALHALIFAIPRFSLPLFAPLSVYAGVAAAGMLRRRAAHASSRADAAVVALLLAALALVCFGERRRNPQVVTPEYAGYFQEVAALPGQAGWAPAGLEPSDRGWIATAAQPSLTGQVAPFPARKGDFFFVSMALGRPEGTRHRVLARLQWSADGTFGDAAQQLFPVEADGERHLYRVAPSLDPAWQGTVGAVRLQLLEAAPGARLAVDRITVAR